MDAATTWILFAVVMLGGFVYSMRRLKGLRRKSDESESEYMTRLYGKHFVLAHGELLSQLSYASLYDGALMPEQQPTLGGALVGARLTHYAPRAFVGLTSAGRLIFTMERGSADNFVPEDFGPNPIVQSDVQAFGRAADGRPPLAQGGLGASWNLIVIARADGSTRRGVWVDADMAKRLVRA